MTSKIKWRLRNFCLLTLSLLYCLIFGAPRKKPSTPPRKIVIVQGAKLGDMVCTTPLLRAIKENLPEAKVIVVGDPVNQRLLAGHPDLDRYLVWKNNFFALIGEIRKIGPDYGLIVLPSVAGLALLFLSAAKSVAAPTVSGGPSPYETRSYHFLKRFSVTVPHYYNHYAPREYLRLLEPLGVVSENTAKTLTVAAEDANKVEEFLSRHNLEKSKLLVGLTPSVGGDKLKLWAPEKFARLAEKLVERFEAKILILGAGADKSEVEAMLQNLKNHKGITNAFGQFSIGEFKALIARLDILISADTGPIYIAEALGTPTVDILGPVHEGVQPPRGELHKVVFAPRKRAMISVVDNFPPDVDEARRQSEVITVEMVAAAAAELMPRILKRGDGKFLQRQKSETRS